jgi:RhtB (resistance to homoserine/threonine) family protein
MDSTQIGLFVFAVLILNITPGPDMLYTIATGAQRGPAAAVVSAVGVGMGALAHGAFIALGLGAIIATSDLAFDVLRITGAAYLIWIGVRSFFAKSKAVQPSQISQSANYGGLFFRGLLTNILNPKVILFFVALLPQFIDPNAENLGLWLFSMAAFVGLSGTLINGAVGVFFARAGRSVLENPRAKKWIDRVTGTIFVGLGVRIFLFERH